MRRLFVCILLSFAPLCVAQSGNISIGFTPNGLNSIQYNGFQYLNNGKFGINAINLVDSSGHATSASISGSTTHDVSRQQSTTKCSWGSLSVTYAASGNKLTLTISTTNTSSQMIGGVFYEPLSIVLPSAPKEYDGVTPILGVNMGAPTALRLTSNSSTVVLTNDDVKLPLLVGFPWSSNRPTSTVFPVRVETSRDSMLPNSIPTINRPIAPGATDTYQISLRFGSASATTKNLVSDLYNTFATVYPFTQSWPDRRPIGQLIIATTAAGFPKNPRGWFNDSSVDVTTPAGVSAFQSRLLSWADTSVSVLKAMNAQGMVTWDVEGEQYPQTTTYICDPAQFATLAPEMNGVIDKYFKKFTDAGLRVGVCVRPQQLVIPSGGGAPSQTDVADPTQILIDKIAYAYNRWGATIFYIDSNGDPNWPMDAKFFANVAAKFPNVLLIPEHQNTQYYSVTAPYDELRQNATGTPQSVLDVYPSAFSVIYTPDGNFSANQSALQAAAKRGDIMMFRGWYPDPQNQNILKLYPQNGVAPPAPVIATPGNNSTVAGTVDLTSSASGPNGVASIQYLLDGNSLGGALMSAPYRYSLDTSSLAPGVHNIQAVASDPIGDRGFTSINVFTGSTPAGTPPSVAITSPANGTKVSGNILVDTQVSSSSSISSVRLSVDGVDAASASSGGAVEFSWNSESVANGTHTLTVSATDSANKTGQSSIAVIVSNSAPAISVTTPANGSVVSGTVLVTTNVTSNLSISGVQFAIDGANLGASVTSAPFQISWDTTSAADGSHVISAIATDSAGNKSSSSITVTVSNSAGWGLLSGSITTPTGTQNLTQQGTADWVHWGLHGPQSIDRRAGSTTQIGTFAVLGKGSVLSYSNNPFPFSWSDASTNSQVSSTATGVYILGQNNGFTLIAPAGTDARILSIYAGVYKAQARLSAQLSDGSAASFVDTSVVNLKGQLSVKYTLNYRAASAGQNLQVTIQQFSPSNDPYSNVTLQSATLQ
jgi:hypothetical protein